LNLGYLVLAGWGFVVWRRRGWGGMKGVGYALVGSVLLRLGLLMTLDNAEPRYTLEFFPVMLVLAGALLAGREG
jgi:hypothetical protein